MADDKKAAFWDEVRLRDDLPLVLDAFVTDQRSPLDRFIDALSDEPPMRAQSSAKEIVHAHAQILKSVQAMLTATNTSEALAHAEYVTRHAREVAYQWAVLRSSVARWHEASADPVVARLK